MNKWIVVLVVLMAADAQASGCKFERSLDQSLDVSGSEVLTVAAAAGNLKIVAVTGLHEVKIGGRACVSDKRWLDDARLETQSGDRAEINVVLPEVDSGWSYWGSKYAFIDLELEVPEGLALRLRDSSGDIDIEGVSGISIRDSSGDIEVRDAVGLLEIEDSSGDIVVRGLEGDLTIIADSSGDIHGSGIEGNVTVRVDSSGDIRFTKVSKDVVVERDSSGDIVAQNVAGDFTVLKDGSGRIRSENIAGEVVIPQNKR